MSETLTKQKTAEMKRHGSRKEQQAAVSIQIGRIADKLVERARKVGADQDLSRDDYGQYQGQKARLREIMAAKLGYYGKFHETDTATRLTTNEHNYGTRHDGEIEILDRAKRGFFTDRHKTKKREITVTLDNGQLTEYPIDRWGQYPPEYGRSTGEWVRINSKKTIVDPTGKKKPQLERYVPSEHKSVTDYDPEPKEVVKQAAPVLRETKARLDAFETAQEKKAA